MKKERTPKIDMSVRRVLDRWSFSSWSQAQKCMFAFYCKYVLNMKETTQSPALQRGNDMHKKAELYLKDETDKLPYDFRSLKKHYAQLKKLDPVVERFWGVDKRFRPVDFKSWIVVKMDAAVEPNANKDIGNILLMQDLKTGKEYDIHRRQADLSVAVGFAMYPDIDGAEFEFWYSDANIQPITSFKYSRKKLRSLMEFWLEEGTELVQPKKQYLPSPSPDGCRYCFLRTDRGGPCASWKGVA